MAVLWFSFSFAFESGANAWYFQTGQKCNEKGTMSLK
jgi:hypothetical protein